ncbi:MAG TPA: hypothetical protein VGM62_15980 [Chthoniobacterales bacterium]|jgi:hypothetical protein
MRVFAFSGLILISVTLLASGQTIDIKNAKQTGAKPPETPAFRPILLGKGPNALINRIDTQSLVKDGQKDAKVMFTCFVNKDGKMVESALYRASDKSELFQKELKKRLVDAQFTPAIYNHNPVNAVYYGTATFVVVNGVPRLRIFSNQEYPELKKESDFIGPQPIFGEGSHFAGLHYPPAAAAQVPVAGVADIKVRVNDKGDLEWMGVVGEHPPLIGFGAQGLMDLDGTKFIPAFLEGKPIPSEVTLPLYYPEP